MSLQKFDDMGIMCLPSSLVEKFDSIPWKSSKTQNKAARFVSSFTNKRYLENAEPYEWTTMSSTYLRQVHGTNYLNWLTPLKSAGIIESTTYYRVGTEKCKGEAKGYRFSIDLYLDDEIAIKDYTGSSTVQRHKTKVVSCTKRHLRGLRLPQSRTLIKLIKEMVSDEYVSSLVKFDSDISQDAFLLNHQTGELKKRYYAKRNNVVDDLKRDEILVNYKDKFMRLKTTKSDYLKSKRNQIRLKWVQDILRLKRRDVYADRNDTNSRLDSNITSVKSSLLHFIKWDEQPLVNIDLSNSQFRLLVLLMEDLETLTSESISGQNQILSLDKLKSSKLDLTLLLLAFRQNCMCRTELTYCRRGDYHKFVTLVKNGLFYDKIAILLSNELNRNFTRKLAKGLMFRLAFAKIGDDTPEKRVFEKHFPSIVNFIKGIKRLSIEAHKESGLQAHEANIKGNAGFAILLQRIESSIFIDEILATLLDKNFKVLSKHDSILCRKSDEKKVKILIQDKLDEILGVSSYILKSEYL